VAGPDARLDDLPPGWPLDRILLRDLAVADAHVAALATDRELLRGSVVRCDDLGGG
jgi:hypothetical protein